MTHLQSLLQNSVRTHPEKTAIRFGEDSYTYEQLDGLVRRVAAGLRDAGVGAGDRVAWLLPNCVEAVAVTLACYQINAVVVPMNYRYVDREILDVIDRVDATVLVLHQSKLEVVDTLLKTKSSLSCFVVTSNADLALKPDIPTFEALLPEQPLSRISPAADSDPALILFTSGSTGHPKGVVHSQAGAYAAIDISRRLFDFTDNDVVVVGKPISHAGGLQTQLMPSLLVGASVVLAMKPAPAVAVQLIKKYSATQYGMLASDLLDFIEYLEANPVPLPSLKNSIGSGDSVPTDLHHRFRDLLGWEVMEGAGMTEIGCYYAANPRYGRRKWGSLGLPTADTKLRIVDDQGQDCPPGKTGEILIRTPSATLGYWNDKAATADLFRDGWLHSGDLARFDDDGYVWFVGRSKLMIVRRGSNIAPAEVETIIDDHPAVHASVVVGLRDAKDGQVPVACVALLEGQDASIEQSIRQSVSSQLAGYKNPERYLFLDELPRTSTGKFDRHGLQELVDATFSGG